MRRAVAGQTSYRRGRSAVRPPRRADVVLALFLSLLVGLSGCSGPDGGDGPVGTDEGPAETDDGRQETAGEPASSRIAGVRAQAETAPVSHGKDAADDAAIWVNGRDPSRSTVIGTDKQGELLVYDLSGRQLQSLPVGDVNNVDVRAELGPGTGFPLGGRSVSLVTATNRSDDTIEVFVVDPDTRELRDVAARKITTDVPVYGLCMYRSEATGRFYAFVVSHDGELQQWELLATDQGTVDARKVRSLTLESDAEGCVADDELGALYVGEESRGIWRFGADPDDGEDRILVASTSDDGPLVADVEGLAIARGADGTGYLIASSQGDNSYAVYTREGNNAFVGSFRIVDGEVDGTQETDGIDVTTTPLSPGFPGGLFVAQVRHNGQDNQNSKLVSFEEIVTILEG